MSRKPVAPVRSNVPDLTTNSGFIGATTVSKLMPPKDTDIPQGNGAKRVYAGIIYLPNTTDRVHANQNGILGSTGVGAGIDRDAYKALLNDPAEIEQSQPHLPTQYTQLDDEGQRALVSFENDLRAWKQKIEAEWQKSPQSENPVSLYYTVYDAQREHFTRLSVKITPPAEVLNAKAKITIEHSDTKSLAKTEQQASNIFSVGHAMICDVVKSVFLPPQPSATATAPAIKYTCPDDVSYRPATHQQNQNTCADHTVLTMWNYKNPKKLIGFINEHKPLAEDKTKHVNVTQDNVVEYYKKLLSQENESKLRAFTQFLERKLILRQTQESNLTSVQTEQGLGYFLNLTAEERKKFVESVLYEENSQQQRTWKDNFDKTITDKLMAAGGYSNVSVDGVNVTTPIPDQLAMEFTAKFTRTHATTPNTTEDKKFSITCDALRDSSNNLTGQVKWTCDLPWKEAYAVIAAQSFHLQMADVKALDEKINTLTAEIQTLSQAQQPSAAQTPTQLTQKKAECAKLEASRIKPREIKIEDIQDGAPQKQAIIDGKTYNGLTEKEAYLIHAHLNAGFTQVHYKNQVYDNTPHVLASPLAVTPPPSPSPTGAAARRAPLDPSGGGNPEEMQLRPGGNTPPRPGSS